MHQDCGMTPQMLFLRTPGEFKGLISSVALQVQECDRAVQVELRNHFSKKLWLLSVQRDWDVSPVALYPEASRGFRSSQRGINRHYAALQCFIPHSDLGF